MQARRATTVVVAVVAVALAVTAAAIALRPERSPVESALAVIDDDGRFSTALEASDAFAEVSSDLQRVDCDARREESCARAHRAAAWAQVTAVLIVGCRPPGVFEARAGLGRYLRGNGDLPDRPRCGIRRSAQSS
jgi:hypothetical protein